MGGQGTSCYLSRNKLVYICNCFISSFITRIGHGLLHLLLNFAENCIQFLIHKIFFESFTDMDHLWLYSLCHCIVCICMIAASVRLCIVISSKDRVTDIQGRRKDDWTRVGSVSCCLRLCLGWVGAVGGAASIPVTIILNMRSAQCLYTCITLVCCPMMARHFAMLLLILLTVDTHLQLRLGLRWVHRLHSSFQIASYYRVNAKLLFL